MRRSRSQSFVPLLGLSLLTISGPALAQSLRNDVWVAYPATNSLTPVGVAAIAATDSVVYVGGDFTLLGPPTGSAVAVDMTTREPLTIYPQVDGPVHTALPDGVGGYYIGGAFTTVQGQPRSGLARIGADGRVLPWNPGVTGTVRAMVATGGKLIVGGTFSQLGGLAAGNLGAINLATGAGSPGWGPGASGTVHALKLSGGLVYAGGSFQDIGGLPSRDYLIAMEPTSGVVQAWDPDMTAEVRSLAVSGSTVYAGGSFQFYGPSNTDGIVAFDAATGVTRNWSVYMYSSGGGSIDVTTLLVRNGVIYCGGKFTNVGSSSRVGAAAVDSVTGQPTAWSPDTDAQGITEWNGQLYVSGFRSVTAVDYSTGASTGWSVTTNATPYGFLPLGTRGVVYGAFTSAGCITRNRLAAISVATGRPTAWNPDLNGPVNALLLSGTTLYVGGRFESVGAVTRNGVASFNLAAGGSLNAWNPSIGTALGGVKALAIGPGGIVYAGGLFVSAGGASRTNLAGLDPTTGLATAFNPAPNGEVLALAYRPGINGNPNKLYVGGAFGTIAGQSRARVASFDLGTGALMTWNPGASGTVRAIAALGNEPLLRVLVGGDFATLGGQSRPFIGSLDQSGVPTTWTPAPNGPVHALAVSGTNYYIAGDFSSLGGQSRTDVGVVGSNGLATGWSIQPVTGGAVRSMALRGGILYAGGTFTAIQGFPHSLLAAITESVSGVADDEPAAPPAAPTVSAWPNPFTRRVTLRVDRPDDGPLAATVFDCRGRLVARLENGPGGPRELTWDGRDLAGRSSPAGVYFVRLDGADAGGRLRVVRVTD
jgi:hypothetical protein